MHRNSDNVQKHTINPPLQSKKLRYKLLMGASLAGAFVHSMGVSPIVTKAYAQARVCEVPAAIPGVTSSPVDVTALSNSGGTFTENASGQPILSVTSSAATISNPAIGHNVSGQSTNRINYNNVSESSVGDSLTNTFSFERAVNLNLRGGSAFGGPPTAMDANQDEFTFVAIGASAGFSWDVIGINAATTIATVSADGLTLTLVGNADTSPRTFAEFNIGTNGQLTGVEVTHTTLAPIANNNARFQMRVPECEGIDIVTEKTLSSGDNTPDIGSTVAYDIAVRNDGEYDATNLVLTDLIPAGLTPTGNNGNVTQGTYTPATGVWDIGDLNIGASAALTIEGTVNFNQGGETVTNTATVVTSNSHTDFTTATDDLSETVVINIPPDTTIAAPICGVDPSTSFHGLSFSLLDPASAAVTNYRLSNAAVIGGQTVDLIAVFDAVPTNTGGTLPRIVDDNFVVNLNTTRTISYSVVETGTNTPISGNFRLRFADIDNNERVGVNTSSVSTLVFNNPTNLTVSESGGFTIATGAAGARDTAPEDTFEVVILGQSSFDIRLFGSGNSGFTMDGDIDVPITSSACSSDIVTTKILSSSDSTPEIGDTVAFQIEAVNNGPVLINDLSLTDLLPVGLTATTNNGTVTSGTYDDSSGLWSIGTLANGESATLTIEGVVNSDQSGQTITNNTSAVTSPTLIDSTTAGDDLTEAVIVNALVDLSISKTNTPGVNGEVDQASDTLTSGATTTYTIVVTNNGVDEADGAIVSDTVGSGLTCASTNPVTITGDGVPAGSFTVADLTGAGITLGVLASGEATTLSYSCEVN